MGGRLTSLLLHAGADATAEDKEGVQPIHWAFASASRAFVVDINVIFPGMREVLHKKLYSQW